MCLALSFALSIWVSRAGLFEAWMLERADAESARIRFFNTITSQPQRSQEGELPTLALQLEYFRRYQLDVQRKYYRERGIEHRWATWRAGVFRWIAFVLIALASAPVIAVVAGYNLDFVLGNIGLSDLSSNLELRERVFIAASTTGAAIQGWLASMALINQDERNAARYAATAKNLEALAERPLEEARDAAATGVENDVRTFIALVQEQISSEHREWVDLRRLVPNLSLERLRKLSLPLMD